MKSPFSGAQIGLYVLGAVLGLYLLGAALLYVDTAIMRTHFVNDLPFELRALIFLPISPSLHWGSSIYDQQRIGQPACRRAKRLRLVG